MNLQVNPENCAIELPFAIYDAFTDRPYSGSQAAVVLQTSAIPRDARFRIAREIGAPATSFVDAVDGNRVAVQFFSTVMELPMCGHGTVCLITQLVETGLLPCNRDAVHSAILQLPNGDATVEYCRNSHGRIEVMLEVNIPEFTPARLDFTKLAQILGVEIADFSTELPPEIANADFTHLCLPMRDLNAMQCLNPDFASLSDFCVSNGIETVAAFSTEVVDSSQNIHVRDFCPAVGVAESAAAGTTNAALASYLLRNGHAASDGAGKFIIHAEQGVELGRPSKVTTVIEAKEGRILRLQVGGVASRFVEGKLNTAIIA